MRRDFPFYAGEPIGIGLGRWTVLLLSIVAGFLLLEFLPERSFQEQLLARLLFVHRIVREDGTLSIARSFRRGEWEAILREAGIAPETVRIVRRFAFRLCVERVK